MQSYHLLFVILLLNAILHKAGSEVKASAGFSIVNGDTINLNPKQFSAKDFSCLNEKGTQTNFIGKTATISNNKTHNPGNNSTSTERTWIAFITIKRLPGDTTNSSATKHTCGGTLISQRLILTAAHCCCDLIHCKARQVSVSRQK